MRIAESFHWAREIGQIRAFRLFGFGRVLEYTPVASLRKATLLYRSPNLEAKCDWEGIGDFRLSKMPKGATVKPPFGAARLNSAATPRTEFLDFCLRIVEFNFTRKTRFALLRQLPTSQSICFASFGDILHALEKIACALFLGRVGKRGSRPKFRSRAACYIKVLTKIRGVPSLEIFNRVGKQSRD